MNVLLKYLKVYSKKLIAIISKSGVKCKDFALQPYQKLNTSAFLKCSMDEISLEKDKNPRSPVLSNKIKWIIFNTFISVIVIVGIVLAVVFATKKKEEESKIINQL